MRLELKIEVGMTTSMDVKIRELERRLKADPSDKEAEFFLARCKERVTNKRKCLLCYEDKKWFTGPDIGREKNISYCKSCFSMHVDRFGLRECLKCKSWKSSIFYLEYIDECDECYLVPRRV